MLLGFPFFLLSSERSLLLLEGLRDGEFIPMMRKCAYFRNKYSDNDKSLHQTDQGCWKSQSRLLLASKHLNFSSGCDGGCVSAANLHWRSRCWGRPFSRARNGWWTPCGSWMHGTGIPRGGGLIPYLCAQRLSHWSPAVSTLLLSFPLVPHQVTDWLGRYDAKLKKSLKIPGQLTNRVAISYELKKCKEEQSISWAIHIRQTHC